MSTATINSTAVQFARHPKKMFRRFAWKEFRMLRSLWLAVAIMGLLIQCAEKMLLPSSSEFALTLLYTALSAAVMYAVGAAATAFSVEHEEETYDLLTRLPTTWWPLFAGKLLVTLVSGLLLAVVLSLVAVAFRGPHLITEEDARSAVGMMGFAIIEAVAWGTLFSLLIKRPLVAAIGTLVVGTLVTSAAVNIASSYSYPLATLNPEAYAHAIPVRLAIVVAVFVLSLNFASDWLTPSTERGLAAHLKRDSRLMTWIAGDRSRSREVKTVLQSVSRRRMLARLLWQTRRESWKLLLAPIGVAVLLIAGTSAAIGLSNAYGEVTSFVEADALLFAPALYGAMAFYADQRRGRYRFLAEHAAHPRYTWFARQIVWLGAFIVVWSLTVGVFAAILVSNMQSTGVYRLNWYLDWGSPPYSPTQEFFELGFGLQIVIFATFATSFGALVAYGVGQLLSMTVRSEILAAFLALLITLIIGAWVWLICLWQLSPVLFLLPIFVGLMLATWLRAPDWIAERNSWRAWAKPALALIATLLLIGAMLPSARLAQMKRVTPTAHDYVSTEILPEQEFAARLSAFQAGDTREAAQTADMYTRVAEKLFIRKGPDFLERWRKPEYMEATGPEAGIEIDEAKIPPDQVAAFKKSWKQQIDARKQFFARTVNEAIVISERPTCRFHFDPSLLAPTPPAAQNPSSIRIHPVDNNPYRQLNELIGLVAGEPMTTPDQPARRFLAALKMEKHLRNGQPTIVAIEQLQAQENILHRIDQWSLDKSRTKEELRDVLDKLNGEFQSPESPVEALLADHVLIGDIIDGKVTPYILTTTPIAPHAYLAYLANQLWWEHERAHQALDRITRRNIYEVDTLTNYLRIKNPQEVGIGRLHHWLRPDYGGLPELWVIQEPLALTSYLVSLEYTARAPVSALNRAYCDNEVCCRATLLQLALALYRLDHKKYPPQLADLVPDYLHELPLDTYALQPFQYLPTGLNLPLKYWSPYGNNERIEPHTPLFWTVGPGDVRLKQIHQADFPDNSEPQPNGDEPVPKKEEKRYEFVNEQAGWWNTKTLAFPLTK